MAKKIFFGNYKGGVGKTTSTFYLAKYFAELLKTSEGAKNKRVLIVDLDSQCSMSEICIRSFDRDLQLDGIKDEQTLNYILHIIYKNMQFKQNIMFDLEHIIKTCKNLHEHVDFIPTSLYYNGHMGLDGLIDDFHKDSLNNVFLLYEVVRLVENRYEMILFDCPPSNNILTTSAFLLSDYYLIPYISDNISIRGVQHYISTVDKIYDKYCNIKTNVNGDYNKHIFKEKAKLLGMFECMRVRNENPRGDINQLKVKRYTTVIKNLIDIQEQLSVGKISSEQGKYGDLAREIYCDIY